MPTPQQLERARRQQENQYSSLKSRPFVGHASSVNKLTEKHMVITPLQPRELDFKHPYLGSTSWLRSSPEIGVKPIIAYRGDRDKPVIIGYHQESSEGRVSDYLEGTGVFRPLRSGEHEFHSSGYAQVYLGAKPLVDIRGGILRSWADGRTLEYGHKAPLLVQKGINNNTDKSLKDETRFGLVKRYLEDKFTFVKIEDAFVKEYLVNLTDITGKNLFHLQTGNVIDAEGNVIEHTFTSNPLRYLREIYTEKNTKIREEIDNAGNHYIKYPSDATEGYRKKIPKGSHVLNIGKGIERTAKSYKGVYETRYSSEVGTAKINITKGKVALGANGVEVLQILSDLLEALHMDTYKGFGAFSDKAVEQVYLQLKNKIESIKGTI